MEAPTVQTLDTETRYSSHWIVAEQGLGKTNLLLNMVQADVRKLFCVITMDAKGELTNALLWHCKGDVTYIDPDTFALNPLDIPKEDAAKAINPLLFIFGPLLGATLTPKQESLLRRVLRSLILGFNEPTILTLQDLLIQKDAPKKYADEISTLPGELQALFTPYEWDSFRDTRGELKWRIDLLTENPYIRKMFSARKTRLDLSALMDKWSVVIIDNSIAKVDEAGSAFLGRYFTAQIWLAAMKRVNQPRKHPVFVYIDEAHRVINDKIAQIIDECRSARVGLIVAHQRAGQIQDDNIRSALENCAIKMANVNAEASYFSKLLHVPIERMQNLPRGQFATHIRGQGSSIIQVPKVNLWTPKTPKDIQELKDEMRALYSEPITHEAPRRSEASRDSHPIPAEADKPIVPPPPEKPRKKKRW